MKNNKIFLYALAIGLTGLVFALGVQKNSESNIKPILEDALQESILIDFHRRQNSKRFSTSGSHLGKKIKHLKIQTENGIETFHFEDSIEQFKATQLAMQYTFIRTNPLNPKDFNTIFQKELEKMGIEGDIFAPDINIAVGSWYLAKLMEDHGGNLTAALAAYNAGSSNVNGWKDESGNLTLEDIQFEETYDYVYKTLEYYENYKKLYMEGE